jgi:hypothetical protein
MVRAPRGRARFVAGLAAGVLILLASGAVRAGLPDGVDAYRRGEFASAAALLRPHAEGGDRLAQYLIGRMYFYGQALPQDSARAADWYRRSAMQGYAPAQLAYGIALDGGWGVARDPRDAVRWYRRAAYLGDSTAMWRLAYHHRRGLGVPRDLTEAWAWFDRLAALGDQRAAVERDWLSLIGLDETGLAIAERRSAILGRILAAPRSDRLRPVERDAQFEVR